MSDIECPYCGYDGSDLKIGRRQPGIDVVGVCRILCSKCGLPFVINPPK